MNRAAELPNLFAARVVTFFVSGKPQGKGDKIILGAKKGRPWLAELNAGPKLKWREGAAAVAHNALGDRLMFDEAVRVSMVVTRLRPKSHFGAKGLKPNQPNYPTSAPDLDKLARSLGDALKGVMWRDDAQITSWHIARRWGSEEGLLVTVEPEHD